MKKFIQIIATLVFAGLVPAAALANEITVTGSAGPTDGSTNVTTGVTATGMKGTVKAEARAEAKTQAQASVETRAKERAGQEIKRRIDNLNQLFARVGAMVKLSASEKTRLQGSLSAQIATMNALQAKINADTVTADLKADVQSIGKGYRVYMLVLPQARIAASADRIKTIVGQMQTLSVKLQARMTANANANTAALQAAYADLQAKIADASAKADLAVSTTANLAVDNGDATVAAANTAALKAARADIETATKDLKAARADIETIIKGLRVKGSVNASATTEVHE